MLGWAVYVSHNKASHKGVALSLTSSHLTARHGQVVCMETRLCVCVCVHETVCECVCAVRSKLSPPSSPLVRQRLLPPPSPLAALFGVFLRDSRPVTPPCLRP